MKPVQEPEWKPSPAPFASYKKQVFGKAASVSEFVRQIGEYPALRKPSYPVDPETIKDESVRAKIAYLKDCLLRYRELTGYGRGICAVQVGIPERIAVVFTPYKELLTIINPVVTATSERRYRYPEICMSCNPIIAPVIRPAWIAFKYSDEDGRTQRWETNDDTTEGRMMNRVFMHEIDHMEGIVNIDRVDSPRDLILQSDPDFYDTAGFEEVAEG